MSFAQKSDRNEIKSVSIEQTCNSSKSSCKTFVDGAIALLPAPDARNRMNALNLSLSLGPGRPILSLAVKAAPRLSRMDCLIAVLASCKEPISNWNIGMQLIGSVSVGYLQGTTKVCNSTSSCLPDEMGVFDGVLEVFWNLDDRGNVLFIVFFYLIVGECVFDVLVQPLFGDFFPIFVNIWWTWQFFEDMFAT